MKCWRAECRVAECRQRSEDHVKHALQGLAAGKYVFVEKPIAVSYAEALQLAEADKKYPGKLFSGTTAVSSPASLLFAIDCRRQHWRSFGSLRRLSFQLRNDWQVMSECEGGQMRQLGPHLIDRRCNFESPVKDIWCDRKHVVAAGDMEDHFRIMLALKTDAWLIFRYRALARWMSQFSRSMARVAH